MAREPVSKMEWLWELTSLALSTLAADTAIKVVMNADGSRLQGQRFEKIRYDLTWNGKTANEGGLRCGLSWDLTVAQIKASMEADPQYAGDPDEPSGASDRMIVLGAIPFLSTASSPAIPEKGLSSYRTMKLPSWDLIEGTAMSFWVYNFGITLTTGTVVTFDHALKTGFLSD